MRKQKKEYRGYIVDPKLQIALKEALDKLGKAKGYSGQLSFKDYVELLVEADIKAHEEEAKYMYRIEEAFSKDGNSPITEAILKSKEEQANVLYSELRELEDSKRELEESKRKVSINRLLRR